jgi:hypothetical protein
MNSGGGTSSAPPTTLWAILPRLYSAKRSAGNGTAILRTDATPSTGTRTRYQIKAQRLTDPKTSRELSPIRDIEAKPFDYLAGLLVGPDYDVMRAALVPFAIVRAAAIYSKHVNGWRFHLRDRLWSESGVLNVTEKLREVFAAM